MDDRELYADVPIDLQEQVKRIVREVVKLEKDRLHEQKPHINADILKVIVDAVTE